MFERLILIVDFKLGDKLFTIIGPKQDRQTGIFLAGRLNLNLDLRVTWLFLHANKTLTLGNDYFKRYHSERERTQGHRVPSINGTCNILNYFVTLAKQMDS